VVTQLGVKYAADYADIFEIRGMARKQRGDDHVPAVDASTVVLGYTGLDKVVRFTRIEFSPAGEPHSDCLTFELSLGPREAAKFQITIRCQLSRTPVPCRLPFDAARARALEEIRKRKAGSCVMSASNGQFNAWINRSAADLHMMTTALPTGPYPYAGVPWFNTPFGRDGLITAFECLWFWPELAHGVLSFLAQAQATETIPEQDAEPGKIVHEIRRGEMAALKEMPFGSYYGSVDGTPLFLLLAGAYYERTGDLCLIRNIWPNLHAAMRWIDEVGDRDGDGFVEYHRASASGLVHQGWKDGDDAIFHVDGSEAVEPIALCEVQSYVYGAWLAAARLADALGLHDQAELPRKRAKRLRDNFDRAFWCDEISSFALAIDGDRRPCRVRASNAGHCLLTGLATSDHARLTSQTLMSAGSFSGWGIRTVDAAEARYNPMAYHNGSVWPHDNALIALGFGTYGFTKEVLAVFQGMFDAAMYFELHRMPELFCGFPREAGEGPVLYPVACAPQSWAAGSVFLLLQSALGLKIDGVSGRISFVRPALPVFLNDLEISSLRVGPATVDLHLTRHGEDANVKVLRRVGEVEILVSH
jgi:glycogen debranching enzyme